MLLALEKRAMNKLLRDFIRADIFKDLNTSSIIINKLTSFEVTYFVQRHLDRARDTIEDKESRKGLEDD